MGLLIMSFADKSGMIGGAHYSLNCKGRSLKYTFRLNMNQSLLITI